MRTVDELRRENLLALAKQCGGVVALANLLGKSQAQVSQWIRGSKDSVSGKPRRLSSDSARYIEERCGKHRGWLDHDHSSSATEAKSNAENQTSADEAQVIGPQEWKILDLVKSLPKSEQDELIYTLEQKKRRYDVLFEELSVARERSVRLGDTTVYGTLKLRERKRFSAEDSSESKPIHGSFKLRKRKPLLDKKAG